MKLRFFIAQQQNVMDFHLEKIFTLFIFGSKSRYRRSLHNHVHPSDL